MNTGHHSEGFWCWRLWPFGGPRFICPDCRASRKQTLQEPFCQEPCKHVSCATMRSRIEAGRDD